MQRNVPEPFSVSPTSLLPPDLFSPPRQWRFFSPPQTPQPAQGRVRHAGGRGRGGRLRRGHRRPAGEDGAPRGKEEGVVHLSSGVFPFGEQLCHCRMTSHDDPDYVKPLPRRRNEVVIRRPSRAQRLETPRVRSFLRTDRIFTTKTKLSALIHEVY